MRVEEIKDLSTWNEFFYQNGSPSFLQSLEWGEFENKTGYEIVRLGIYSSSDPEYSGESRSSRPNFAKASKGRQARTLIAIAQVVKIKSKRGNFIFIPHGPVFNSTLDTKQSTVKAIIRDLLNHLIKLARNENFSFIRVAPTLEDIPENQKIFSVLGFKKAPIYMHAERLWVLPLTVETRHPSTRTSFGTGHGASSLHYINDEQLLSGMRKTTRYLIRKAQRDGIVIEKRTDEKAVDDFYKIYEETARRENFVPFSKEFIGEEFKSFNKTGNALFLFGKIDSGVVANAPPQNDPLRRSFSEASVILASGARPESSYLASALIIFTKSTAFYHQGASIHTKIPITYLLQWEAIKEAKKRGCQFYNFWGILQEGRSPKNWQGLTLFKTGFGGYQVDYLPTQDYIISSKYYLTYLYEKFLAWRRGV